METQNSELKAIQQSIGAMANNLKELSAKMLAEKNAKDEKTHGDFDEKFTEMNGLIKAQNDLIAAHKNSIDEFLQTQASIGGESKKYNSFGDKFVAEYKDKDGKVEVNTLTSDGLGGVYRWGGMETEKIRWTLFDLIPLSYIADSKIDYIRVSADYNAHPVNEGTVKPHTHLTRQAKQAVMQTIANYEMVTRQALKSDSELRNTINNELYNALVLETENQIINGTGQEVTITDAMGESRTFIEWDGIMQNATAFDPAIVANSNSKIVLLRYAMAQVVQGRGWADGIILNALDWADIETATVNENGTGAFIIGHPADGTARRNLWGLPVVDTFAMPAGKFIVGAFKTAARVFLQNEGVVTMDGWINNQFIKNELTILAELSGNVGVKKPLQIIKGDFV